MFLGPQNDAIFKGVFGFLGYGYLEQERAPEYSKKSPPGNSAGDLFGKVTLSRVK